MPSPTRKTRSKERSNGSGESLAEHGVDPGHYQIVVRWSERDSCYLAHAPALQGCRTHGDTPEEALRNALEAVRLWLEDAVAHGDPIPRRPREHSGRLTLRLPPSLHEEIAACAEREGVSINRWLVTRVASLTG